MTVRVWLDPKKSGAYKPEKGLGMRIDLAGVPLVVYTDNGLVFFHTALTSPINPGLRSSIVRVTYQLRIEDPEQIKKVERGFYRHGRFEAHVTSVMHSPRQGDAFRALVVEAGAPTMGQLNRWLRPLLAGEDVPAKRYGHEIGTPIFGSGRDVAHA